MSLVTTLTQKLTAFDLANHLPTYTLAQAAPFFWLGFLSSWVICYLVHQPGDTRALRMGLWPLAVASNMWGVLTVEMSGRLPTWNIVGLVFFNAVCPAEIPSLLRTDRQTSAAIRWGLATAPPVYHPLPRRPYWPTLRQSGAVKALNLIFDEPRLISVAGSSPPLPRSPHTTLYHIAHHFLQFIVAFITIDVLSYPMYHYDPTNLGHPSSISANWEQGISTISARSGLPVPILVPALILSGSVVTYLGMSMVWHPAAMVCIASGIWVPEEWPKVMNRPWMACSLNQLWGKRYHQMLRNSFHNYTRFLSFLPPYFAILRIFLASAVYHMLTFHPAHRAYKPYSFCAMFLLSGLGLELERQFYRVTGRRVGGWTGRVWTWCYFLFCGYFMIRGVAEIGWLGGIRRVFAEDRRTSVVEWVLYSLGTRPHPSVFIPIPLGSFLADGEIE